MRIRSLGGTDVIVGQAAYNASEFELFCQRRDEEHDPALQRCILSNATWSAEAYIASLTALEQVRPDRAFFSHDQLVWTRAA
jgi:hypothetical protein